MTQSLDELGEFDPESSILFLGSGFSLGATNIAGKNPPNGAGLRRHFIEQLGLPSETTYDLQILTEEFAEKDAQKLRDELYRIFRVTTLSNAQKAILNERWRRIYTTNYDDAVEIHRLATKASPNAFDVSEAVPNKLPHGAVIHLHGSIRLITPDNLHRSLVLGEASYVNQNVVRSPWYDQFQRDLAFAGKLYIIGYSLADFHIAALLLENPTLAARTVFIQGPTPDPIFVRRTAKYGRTMFIGTERFADALACAPRPSSPKLDNLRSFRTLSPIRDRRASAQPTATEVYDLLVYGDFDPGRLARSQPGESYAIARADMVRAAADAVECKAALVVDARLGNGKTIFLHLLAFELVARGWTCFLFKPGHPEIAQEVAALSGIERLVVFIEQYSAAQDTLKGLREALPNARLVIEVRTGTYEVRFHELVTLLPSPFDRVSLNALSRLEIKAFCKLCENAGLRPPDIDRAGDLRDILLDLFKNQAIRERVRVALTPLFEKRATRRILIMTMLIATHQGAVGAAFIRSVVGEDPFAALKPLEGLSNEIFDISADNFRARSAVFSSFVLNDFIEPNEIADAVVDVTLAAAKRRSERPYRVLMSNMMAYGSLRQTLHGKGEFHSIIIGIYERLRYDERVNGEPLFWLQYAIAMAELSKLDIADEFIQTAYRKTEELPGFQTYQIDTQAFRIALMRARMEPRGREVFNIDRILSGLERIETMLTDSSHRTYAVRVLDGVQAFVAERHDDLAASEKIALQFWLLKIVKSLATLPDDFKATTNSEAVRAQIDAAAASLITSSKS
ncbi:SIR2 family protein [Laribacter hongkongensis]|uniref:SIR2 family protein n=1 Tax=Laribacter hongkongensis TaxID=168471 RepID=UPI001EFC8BC3|nr:SIR2 family protein [Laribacter hongkongensis]MCG9079937.1 SIR2 family protein [Laribacter hongkongensis]